MDALVDIAFNCIQDSLSKNKSAGKFGRKQPRRLSGPPTAIQSKLDSDIALNVGQGSIPSLTIEDEQAAAATMHEPHTTAKIEQGGAVDPLYPSTRSQAKSKKQQRELNDNAGKNWFNMPATKITPEVLTNLKLLKMRHVFDPKHFMKQDKSKLPKYFQIGTEVDTPLDYYANKGVAKKKTLVDVLLADESVRKYHKKRFKEIQTKRMVASKGKFKKSKKPLPKKGKRK